MNKYIPQVIGEQAAIFDITKEGKFALLAEYDKSGNNDLYLCNFSNEAKVLLSRAECEAFDSAAAYRISNFYRRQERLEISKLPY